MDFRVHRTALVVTLLVTSILVAACGGDGTEGTIEEGGLTTVASTHRGARNDGVFGGAGNKRRSDGALCTLGFAVGAPEKNLDWAEDGSAPLLWPCVSRSDRLVQLTVPALLWPPRWQLGSFVVLNAGPGPVAQLGLGFRDG